VQLLCQLIGGGLVAALAVAHVLVPTALAEALDDAGLGAGRLELRLQLVQLLDELPAL
jgi:hypothetical protein